jgi:hypothetical protein
LSEAICKHLHPPPKVIYLTATHLVEPIEVDANELANMSLELVLIPIIGSLCKLEDVQEGLELS